MEDLCSNRKKHCCNIFSLFGIVAKSSVSFFTVAQRNEVVRAIEYKYHAEREVGDTKKAEPKTPHFQGEENRITLIQANAKFKNDPINALVIQHCVMAASRSSPP